MNALTVLTWTLAYFSIDLSASYLLNYFFDLHTSFLEILAIAVIFSTILVILLTFDVPEKIANKIITKKPEIIFYNYNEDVEPIIDNEEYVVDNFFERKQSAGKDGGVKVEENKERMGEIVS